MTSYTLSDQLRRTLSHALLEDQALPTSLRPGPPAHAGWSTPWWGSGAIRRSPR